MTSSTAHVSPSPSGPAGNSASQPNGGTQRSPWAVFALCAAASYITTLDVSIVNVAFPEIARAFKATRADVSWVVTIYNICFAGLLIVSGKMADQLGRKRLFLIGGTVFATGSAACAFAPSLIGVIVGRMVQGAGGAMLAPASLGLLLAAFPVEKRSQTIALWGTFSALGIASGPSLGAGLIDVTNWRAAFWVNLPVCLAMLWFGAKVFVESPRVSGGRPDLLGALLVTLSLGALALGLSRSEVWGWSDWKTIGSLAVALVCAPIFWKRQATHPNPILDLSLFKSRPFRLANLASIAFSAAFAAGGLNNVLFLRNVWQYGLLHAGLLSTLPPITVALLAPQSAKLSRRVGFRPMLVAGPLIYVAASLCSRTFLGATPKPWLFLAFGELVALGVVAFIPINTAASVSDLPPERLSIGGAVSNTTRQAGSVVGIAALVALIGSPDNPVALLDAHHRGFVLNACFGLVAALIGLRQPSRPAKPA